MLLYPCTEKRKLCNQHGKFKSTQSNLLVIFLSNLVLLNMGAVKWFIVWNTGFVPLY